jgi:DNA-binding GntR family transcriptional regulator
MTPSDSTSFVSVPIGTASAAEQVQMAIRRGELLEGCRLPPELGLAEQYRVRRETISEAMELLKARQLPGSTRGAEGGTFIQLPRSDAVTEAIGETLPLWLNAGNASVTEVNAARDRARLRSAHGVSRGEVQ